MSDPVVVRVMREFKLGLLLRERGQMAEMARRWLEVEGALEAQISALAMEAEALRQDLRLGSGQAQGVLGAAKIKRMARYRALLAQIRAEMAGYAGWAGQEITVGQGEMARLGIEHAVTATRETLRQAQGDSVIGVFFDVLPVDAVEHMVGLAGDGSPLRKLLEAKWGEAAEALTNWLVKGTGLGWNPRKTARHMKQGLTRGLNEILTIARTEQLRVYREAGRAQYEKSGVVKGFRRLATHDGRVCAACLMAEGEVYPLNEPLRDHPNGR
jgi:SPP1 gp7 family putative phage head morphogenesis protein